ncbi:MAG: 2-C-methyl-D-erythritol 4-phosphate cytidylyltransferase [Kiritimatiellia bacterium]
MKQTTWGLVMATGKSEQITSEIETAFLYLNDRPVLAYSLAAFMRCADIEGIVVVVSRERAESVLGMVQMFGYSKVRKIVVGGARRSASMAAGLEHVDDEVEFVCVHDASRPMVTPALISETVRCAWKHGSGVAAAEIADAVVSAKKGAVAERQDGDERLWTVVSPQTYPRAALAKAYPKAAKNRKNYDDDLAAALAQGIAPRLVPAPALSLRIRSAEDLAPALALMK